VAEVEWRPPAGGDAALVRLLVADAETRDRVDAANRETMARMFQARPVWSTCARQRFRPRYPRWTLHALRSRTTIRANVRAHRRAAAWAAVFEGWAPDPESAALALANGGIKLEPANAHSVVIPMAGVISPSMAFTWSPTGHRQDGVQPDQ